MQSLSCTVIFMSASIMYLISGCIDFAMHGDAMPPLSRDAQHGHAITQSIRQFIGHGQKPHDLGLGGPLVKMQHGQHLTMQYMGHWKHGTHGSQQDIRTPAADNGKRRLGKQVLTMSAL